MPVALNSHAAHNREYFSHVQAGMIGEDFISGKIVRAVQDALMETGENLDKLAGYRDVSKSAVARRLKALRKSRDGMTQPDLADALGVPDERLKAWEKGAALPPPFQVLAISDLFGVTSDYLYFGDWRSLRGDVWEAVHPFLPRR